MQTLLPPADGRIVFVDTEFTTLDRYRRKVWEIGAIVRDPGRPDVELEWQIRPDLRDGSPDSARIARYYRRCRIHDRPVGAGLVIKGLDQPELAPGDPIEVARLTTAEAIAAQLAPILDGAILVGKVISADELALDLFMREYGQLLTHHYRITCVGSLAVGFLHGRREERELHLGNDLDVNPVRIPAPPWDSKELMAAIGVPNRPDAEAHRALVDARWARDVFDRVHGNADPR